MKNLYQTSVFILFFVNQAFAQNDTVKCHEKFEKPSPWVFIVPSALVSYGIIAQFSPALHDFDRKVDRKISRSIHGKYIFDDYIQYLPYAGIYMPNLCGVKAKHNVLDRTLVLGASITICASAVQISKHTTRIARPDGSNKHSFPSGHTATAFLGAHILFREYKDVSPWIGIAGYGVAATTGVMRVTNRKHWLSDVFAGAGTGIISVELSYLMLPVWHRLFGLNGNANYLTINPLFLPNGFGFGISCVF
jgi:membrane-associated phospholipid phosphatase